MPTSRSGNTLEARFGSYSGVYVLQSAGKRKIVDSPIGEDPRYLSFHSAAGATLFEQFTEICRSEIK